jgi:hemerythrin-like domain-containing protein
MKATGALKHEHEAIKLMLQIMEAACVQIETEKKVHVADVDEMIDFLKVFADQCHHGKEENILFPCLEKAGIPREGGPIGVMLAEHEQGRKYIANMGRALTDYEDGAATGLTDLVENIRSYAELLEQHINKENNVLFAMADRVLTEETQDELFEEFEELEEDVIGRGKHEELHKRLERLSGTYLKD